MQTRNDPDETRGEVEAIMEGFEGNMFNNMTSVTLLP